MDTRLTRRTVLGVLGVGPLGVARAAAPPGPIISKISTFMSEAPRRALPDAVVEKTKRDYMDDHLYKGPTPSQRHFDALKRILDRKEPDYAT